MDKYSTTNLCTTSSSYFSGRDALSDSDNEEQNGDGPCRSNRGDGHLTPCSSTSQELCIPDPYETRAQIQEQQRRMQLFRDFKGPHPLQGKRTDENYDYIPKRMKPELPRGVRLGSAWTYWYIITEGSEADWKEGMKPMCTFDYKEQFWGMWNAIKPPSELTAKRELALFRGGFGRRPVWPDWNDQENIEGGRWKIIFKVTELPQIVDNFWRDLMVHCIEERWVPYSGFVNGVSITVKGQFYRIYIWLCSTRPAYVEFLKDRVKELLKDIPCVQMDYVTGNGERQPRPSRSGLQLQLNRLPEEPDGSNLENSHPDLSIVVT